MKVGVTKLGVYSFSRLFICDLGHIVGQFTLFLSPLRGASLSLFQSLPPVAAEIPGIPDTAGEAMNFG